MRLALISVLLAFGLGHAGLATADPVTIAHSRGTLTVGAPVPDVLILDINALDIAAALGAEPRGVLGTNLPDYLEKFAGDAYPKMGSIFEPDYEAIAASGAGLMIVGTRSARSYDQMTGILPTIDLSLTADHFDAVRRNITAVGQVFGRTEQAADLIAALDARIDGLRAVAPGSGTALILVVNGGKLGAYGPTSRIGWIHTELGFATVEADIDDRFHGGDVVSFEYILEKDPDWIFVIDRDAGVGSAGAGARAVLDNALMARTRAVQAGRVVHLDPHAAYIAFGGYTAMTRLLDQLTQALAQSQ